MKSDPASTSLDGSENSLRWARVALGILIVLFGVSIFIPDWEGLWVIGLAVPLLKKIWLSYEAGLDKRKLRFRN